MSFQVFLSRNKNYCLTLYDLGMHHEKMNEYDDTRDSSYWNIHWNIISKILYVRGIAISKGRLIIIC